MAFNNDDTVDEIPALVPKEPVVAELIKAPGIEIGAITHRGAVRDSNQDQYAVVRRSRTATVLASSLNESRLPYGEDNQSWLLIVADGLGGHASGEVASETAVRTLLNFANGLSSWIMRPMDGLRDDIVQRAELYAQAIQSELQQQVELEPQLTGMATTLTAAYVFGSEAVIANVGDSRSYLLRSDQICQITVDHTLAQEMQDVGHPPEETRSFRNLLTRCFNTEGGQVNVDLFHLKLFADDQLLLCSDGLTGKVPDRSIRQIVNATSSSKDACERLVTAALRSGGEDNITVVIGRIT